MPTSSEMKRALALMESADGSAARMRKSTDKQFYFVIVAKNGQVLATSETYKTKAKCKNGFRALAAAVMVAAAGDMEDET